MANNLRKFTTEAEYSAATLIYPSVSLVTDTRTVHFDKTAPTPPALKYKLTLSDGSTVSAECDGTSAITQAEISAYSQTCVAAEIGDCVTTIGNDAFRSWYGDGFRTSVLSSITIPSSVTTIGSWAFAGCSALTEVTLPGTITAIGHNAFNRCINLTNFTVPSGVTTLETGILHNCTSLTSFTIPSGITNIGDMILYNCTSLTAITVESTTPATMSTLNKRQFDNTNNCPIYVPCESLSLYQQSWADYASRLQCIPTPSYEWVSYESGDTVPTATTVYGVKLYANYDESYNIIFSGTTGDYIKFHPNGNFGQWSAEDENGTSIDISSYYQAGSMMYTIVFSDLGLGGMNIISPTTIFEDDIDLYT